MKLQNFLIAPRIYTDTLHYTPPSGHQTQLLEREMRCDTWTQPVNILQRQTSRPNNEQIHCILSFVRVCLTAVASLCRPTTSAAVDRHEPTRHNKCVGRHCQLPGHTGQHCRLTVMWALIKAEMSVVVNPRFRIVRACNKKAFSKILRLYVITYRSENKTRLNRNRWQYEN